MILGMIPATSLPAFAAKDQFTTSVTGIEIICDEGYSFREEHNVYYLKGFSLSMISGTSKFKPDTYSSNSLYTDEACTTSLRNEPELGETYYFNVSVYKADTTNNITNSNSNIKINGFSNGKVLSTRTTDQGFFYCVCSALYGELTGGVKAVASGVKYDSEKGGYAPNFTTLKAVSTEGKELEHIVLDGNYHYYGATAGLLYKNRSYSTFSDKLTTEPQEGETYYSYFRLDSIDGNLNIEEDLVDIQIPGYKVEYLASYESDMGFTSLVVYKATKVSSVYVGGVCMYDGDYLAVGATKTQTTKPAGGYAYYKNGTLTLDNYSYTGKGYSYVDNGIARSAIIYASNDIEIKLVGTNNLTQKSYTNTACISGDANVSLTGAGTLNLQNAVWGIRCKSDLSIESGNLNVDACDFGVYSWDQEVIINGGSLKIDATKCAVDAYRGIEINGGSGIFRNTQDSVYNVLHAEYGSGPVTIDPLLLVMASTTADGELGVYVPANLANYKKIVIKTLGVYVGGVAMYDGDYLAVGATATQTTKPSGGYAYYEDGTLTLNNYSYEGKGYRYDSPNYYATVFSEHDLTVELVGTNSLKQTASDSDGIFVGVGDSREKLTIQGDGSLNVTSTYCCISAWGSITVNSGTVISTAPDGGKYKSSGIGSLGASVIINGGNVTVSGDYGLWSVGYCEINGGNVTATGTDRAIKYSTGFTIADGLNIQASTTVDGELVSYVKADNNTYKRVVIKPVPTHTVTFKVDTTTVATKTVENGKTVTAPADPVKDGYKFLGWYTDGGTKFDFTTPITGDINLTARYEEISGAVMYGDVNQDGKIDATDSLAILHAVVGKITLTDAQKVIADVNGDGEISATDALVILHFIVGKIEKFPVEE